MEALRAEFYGLTPACGCAGAHLRGRRELRDWVSLVADFTDVFATKTPRHKFFFVRRWKYISICIYTNVGFKGHGFLPQRHQDTKRFLATEHSEDTEKLATKRHKMHKRDKKNQPLISRIAQIYQV